MNHQEIFTKAVMGVIEQGDVAVSDSGSCMYRTTKVVPGKGTVVCKCGIGQLIPEGDYDRALENTNVTKLVAYAMGRLVVLTHEQELRAQAFKRAMEHSGIDITDDKTVVLLSSIQSMHDKAEDIDHFIDNVHKFVASEHNRFGLVLPEGFPPC